jgi:hypothetical protein
MKIENSENQLTIDKENKYMKGILKLNWLLVDKVDFRYIQLKMNLEICCKGFANRLSSHIEEQIFIII